MTEITAETLDEVLAELTKAGDWISVLPDFPITDPIRHLTGDRLLPKKGESPKMVHYWLPDVIDALLDLRNECVLQSESQALLDSATPTAV